MTIEGVRYTQREREILARTPKKIRETVGHTKMICMSCEGVVSLNKWGLCIKCRGYKCKRCKCSMSGNGDRPAYCIDCRARFKNSEGLF